MAKHKAPTQVTIAATEEKTVLHELVERYWKTAASAGTVLILVVMASQWMTLSGQKDTEAKWDRLGEEVQFQLFGNFEAPGPAVLADLSNELGTNNAGGWAKAIEIAKRIEEGDVTGAKQALSELEADWPDHALVNARVYPGPDGQMQTLRERLEARPSGLADWEANHRFLFENPALPADAPRVRISTTAGDMVVGLYTDRAPEHSGNFLKHCREGFYDNIKFHRVMRGFMIQAGDPNTIEGEPETWGQGGTDYTLPMEIDSALKHFKGYLAAAKKPGATESSGSQFYITTADSHQLDGDYTIYGQLLEGADIAETIETGAVVGDRPQDPVVITGTTILE